MKVVMYLGGKLVIGDIFVRGSFSLFMRDVVRTYCIFSFLSFIDELFLLCDSNTLFFHPSLHVLFLFSHYAHASY